MNLIESVSEGFPTYSRMLRLLRSEYVLRFYVNYVKCKRLFACKHCLALHTMFPTKTKIRHESLNLMVAICRTQIEGQSLIEGHFPHRGPISSQIKGRFIFPTSRAEIVTYAQ